VKVAEAAETKSVSYREVVIAKDGKNAIRRGEPAQLFSDGVDILVPAMDKITGKHRDIGVLRLRQVDCFRKVFGGDFSTAMEIGQLNDTKAIKSVRQTRYGDVAMV